MGDLEVRAIATQGVGGRSRQEDAIVVHAPEGGEAVLAILSDGMGGHTDGDMASRIIVGEMFKQLFLATPRLAQLADNTSEVLKGALRCANMQLKSCIEEGRLSSDTGGTLLCASILNGQLRWVSVGDSPLYLFRDGALHRLNEVHSMGRQLDLMVSRNEMDAATARDHPDRGCLTSAVTGEEIPRIDCPDASCSLLHGDIVLLASDGINVLKDDEIGFILDQHDDSESEPIARALLEAALDVGGDQQDNTSIAVVRVQDPSETGVQTIAHVEPSPGAFARWRRMLTGGAQSHP